MRTLHAWLAFGAALVGSVAFAADEAANPIVLETRFLRLVIDGSGHAVGFEDRATGQEYAASCRSSPCKGRGSTR